MAALRFFYYKLGDKLWGNYGLKDAFNLTNNWFADSYLAIEPDGAATVFYGRIDGGQGLETSIAQMVAEELDVDFARVRMVMSDTARTVNMGGASDALGVSRSGMHLRKSKRLSNSGRPAARRGYAVKGGASLIEGFCATLYWIFLPSTITRPSLI